MREPPVIRGPESLPHAPGPQDAQLPQGMGFRDNRTVVLLILFLATGCLGLPLLWASRAFPHKAKVFWSIVVTIYTLVLLAALAGLGWWVYHRVVSALGNGM